MSVPFTLTIDWLAFTLPSCSLQDTLQVLGGDWIQSESGFRRYPVSWITTGSDRGIGKLGTGAARNPLEVHVDLSAGIVAPWPSTIMMASERVGEDRSVHLETTF